LLVGLAGGPTWLAAGYAALGACIVAYRLWRAARSRPARYVPGPRLDGAGQLVLGPPPARRRVAEPAAPQPPARRPSHGPAPSTPPAVTAVSESPPKRPAQEAGAPAGDSALGYMLVDRATNGGDPGKAIRELCGSRGYRLGKVVRDVEVAAGDQQARPALRWVLDQLAADEAQILVVAELGHLTDTAADLPDLLRWLSMRNRRLIAIDVRLDTATEAGERTADALAQVGGWEREKLSQRTRRGLAAARSRGPAGRPAVADTPELRERIVAMREEGMTLQGIADALNEEGVPTIRGGAKWRPSSVQAATGYRRPSAAKRLQLPQDRPSAG
jgi:DNA invertase Pin-like site-specific DNA recombinase